ncbi:MAG TPA: inner membrane CreD family protein [Terracidiphilus sp.]|jgi:inner membrane protein
MSVLFPSLTNTNLPSRLHSTSRSAGVKLVIICFLAVLMNIPGLFVQGLVNDRMAHPTAPAWRADRTPDSSPVEPYRSVDRSLKYILLFEGLVFLTYFTLEVSGGKRMHSAQYVLVGIAQVIFYLLLLSLTEKIGFDLAFLIAGAATVGLLAANAAWVFAKRTHGLRALAAFIPLYGFIYVLLRLKDYALLVGAVASFAAVAATMYFTRSIDWYGDATHAPGRGAADTSESTV